MKFLIYDLALCNWTILIKIYSKCVIFHDLFFIFSIVKVNVLKFSFLEKYFRFVLVLKPRQFPPIRIFGTQTPLERTQYKQLKIEFLFLHELITKSCFYSLFKTHFEPQFGPSAQLGRGAQRKRLSVYWLLQPSMFTFGSNGLIGALAKPFGLSQFLKANLH